LGAITFWASRGAAPTRTKRRKPPFGARFWRRWASRQTSSSPCRDTAIWEAWWPRWAIPSWRSEFGKYSQPHQRELIEIIELPLEEVYEILYAYKGFDTGAVITLPRSKPILTELELLG